MSDAVVTHKGKSVLAYRHEADYYCLRCGVPADILQRASVYASGVWLDSPSVIVYTITEEEELYDGGHEGEHSELAVRYRDCATCGESLDPNPMGRRA